MPARADTLHSILLFRLIVVAFVFFPVLPGWAQLVGNSQNSLPRYTPIGADFVITNGNEYFNRPLYGGHTAFRVDAGDRPEFSLYLPGRGGNLRLGVKTVAGVKWLNDADRIVASYRAGSMVYQINDSFWPGGQLNLTVLPLSGQKGIVVRAAMGSLSMPVELVCAFGGANGMKGQRGGDIGCERETVGQFFQLQPEECAADIISTELNSFLLRGKSATICGVGSLGANFAIADAKDWTNAGALLSSCGKLTRSPVAFGRIPLAAGKPVFLSLTAEFSDSNVSVEIPFAKADALLPELFSLAEAHRQAIAGQVVVESPDPYINAASAALNVAADAIWDEQQQSFMHGAVAWRQRLLGWRGPYAGDELGWHERTAAHFIGFAKQQNISPVPAEIPLPEASANLSRNETALHSNGDLTKAHYDMNLLAVDAFFRHLLWTGDLQFARTNWPVIERHFAWERRLFRREFGPDKLPLYEGYAAIWASDDLAYNGGGAAHASALNFYANKMAARVAPLIEKDPTPYAREADLISRAMQKYLWLPEEGNFAEFKDYLGLQLPHPNAAVWAVYHAIDSEIPTPEQSWQMTEWVDRNLAHFPIPITRGTKGGLTQPKSPECFVLPTTSWMPYQWSLNNVVVAESAHASLGFWQANRADTAVALFKGTLLDTMYCGLCPGNIGCMTARDAARGEAQRDFGDGIGAVSRALVEGLFGVRPDALSGELKVVPGFPTDWEFARIHHPDFNFEWKRDGLIETYVVESRFPKPMKLMLLAPALRKEIERVTVNGEPAACNWVTNLPGKPRVEIVMAAATRWVVELHWRGEAVSDPEQRSLAQRAGPEAGAPVAFDWNKKFPDGEKFETVNLAAIFNDRVTQIFKNDYRSPRSPFCSLATPKQGIGSWCHPDTAFEVDDSGLRAAAAKAGDRIILPDGVPLATPSAAGSSNIVFVSQWDNYPREISVPLDGHSSHAFLLLAGSTGAMQSRFDNGEVVVIYADGSTVRLPLRNPTTWWPIDQDYYIDDFAFYRPEPPPARVDLKTGKIRVLDLKSFKGQGNVVPGGAATVLELPLDTTKELKSLTVRALANEVVIGLMAVTLQR